MAGLVGYDSSDDDSDGREEPQVQTPPKGKEIAQNPSNGAEPAKGEEKPRPIVVDSEDRTETPTDRPRIEDPIPTAADSRPAASESPSESAQEPAQGPALGPALGPTPGPAPAGDVFGPSRPPADSTAATFEDDDEMDGYSANGDSNEPPLSPYSAERAAVRQLTMPSVPDFDIPGSPDPDAAATSAAALAALNKKFATFLELKQKKDTHFNARLAQSDAMKNPALMDKLMAFVGMPANAWGGTDLDAVDEEGGGSSSFKGKQKADKPVDTALVSAQYATTLPLDLWDPAAFPPEAYRRSLRRLQEEAAKQRARAPGERVEFVSSTAASTSSTPGIGIGAHDGSEKTSRSGTPATGKRKSRFD